MPRPPVSEETLRSVLQLVDEHNGNISAAAAERGVARTTISDQYYKALKHFDITKDDKEDTRTKFEFKENIETGFGTIESKSERIKTIDEALAYGNIDLDIWEPVETTVNSYEVDMRLRQVDPTTQKRLSDKPIKRQIWQIKIKLRRKVSSFISNGMANLLSKINVKWKPPKIKQLTNANDRYMVEISLSDVHFGKLAWGAETGCSYDLKEAEYVYLSAIDDLLEKIGKYNIEYFLLPLGNDFFHVNNWINTTANGTPQDVDSRMQKIFEVGCSAVINGVNRCLEAAPVKVMWVPGNHDRETSWYMTKYLEAWYRNINEVTVDKSPTERKYELYGINLIGFTHGNEEKHGDLPLLMGREAKREWADAECLAWHLGHYHKKKELRFNPQDEFNGVIVQVLPSLCGVDAWHYRKGFVKNRRAAEAYLWEHDQGYVGHFSVNARSRENISISA